MNFVKDDYNWVLRLDRGEKLMESLEKLVKEQDIPSCWISVIGGASEVTLGYYALEAEEYRWQTFIDTLEIASLSGNLAWQDDKPVFHIHGTLSMANFHTIGGHVKELTVGGTCEIFLHRWFGEPFKRTKDKKTGLNILDL